MKIDRIKRRRSEILSSGTGAMLSMFVPFVGTLPQPVAAAAPIGLELTIERSGHTATVLQGNKVLIVGGKNTAGTAIPSAEVVDLADPTSAQNAVGSLTGPRTEHTATPLSSGDILVAGGSNGSTALDTTELFNHADATWSAGSPLQAARAGHTATLLADGNVLIVGGDATGTAEIYGSSGLVSLNTPRSKHSAIRLNDGKVLIVGGVGSDNAPLTSAELYDPATSTFTTVPTSLAVARVKPDLRLLPDGKVQVIGGADDGSFEMYDPDENNAKPGFNAKVQAVNATTSINEVLNAQTRGAILFDGSVVPGGPLSDILNRNGAAATEIAQPAVSGVPQASKVLISGGVSSTAETGHHSAYVVDGSPATITTNATDYAPGTDVYVYAKGWRPGETVDFMLHKVKADGVVVDWTQPVSWTTDANGELNGYAIYQPVAPDDVNAKFTLTAVGQTSGFVAQTAFTDSVGSVSITSPTSAAQTTVTSLPLAVTIAFDYSSSTGTISSPHTTSAVARICSSAACSPAGSIIASNTKTLTSGSNLSDSINVTLPAGTPNSSSPHYTVQVEVTSSPGSPGPATRTDTKTSAVIVDTTKPTVTVNQAAGQSDPTGTSPINFTVVFSESVNNFATGDVTLSGTAGATTATVTGSGTTYNVAVSGMTNNGTVIASIAANVATDAAGNGNFASTSTDNTVTYTTDTTKPTVTINQASGQADPTNASPINFTVVFSEIVNNFATGDVTLSGTAGATTATVTGSGTTYNVAVSGMTGDGTVIASIAANVATDAAGNGNEASTSDDNQVTYDTTKPTVTINQAMGQVDPVYAEPVNFTVVFSENVTGFDSSDINLGSSTAPGTIFVLVTGSGTTYNVAVSGMTGSGDVIASIDADKATDAAGNGNAASTSTDNTVSFVFDNTAPTSTITLDPAASNGDNGWYKSDVKVTVAATDNMGGSGVAETRCVLDPAGPPANFDALPSGCAYSGMGADVTTEGEHVVYAASKDNAGNKEPPVVSASFKIDKTAPIITYDSRTPANGNGWNNTDVTVTWTCSDALSGAVSTPVTQTVSTEGAGQSATGTCTDSAGNSSSDTQNGINIDKTAPSTSATPSPEANVNGWNNSNVTVTFSGTDGLSGIAICDADVTLSSEGAGQSASGICTDLAGNSSSATASGINIDMTAPTVTASASPAPNGNGWNNSDVTVTFSGMDSLSGIDSCTPATTLSSEGAGQSASGSCTDKAGNESATATASGINIDKTAPELAWVDGPADGANYYFGSVPAAPTCTASDSLSGPGGCSVSGYSAAVGSHTLTATAYDMAGNSYQQRRTFNVLAWTLKGFYQPVDMTPEYQPTVWNTVKNGSTIPLKFEIFAGETELTDTANVMQPLQAKQVMCSGGSEDTVDLTATGGTSLRYDTTGGQFIYNWQTPKGKAGYCYTVTVKMQDGGSLTAYFKLK